MVRTPHVYTFCLASLRSSNLKLILYHPLNAPGAAHSTNYWLHVNITQKKLCLDQADPNCKKKATFTVNPKNQGMLQKV